MVDGDIGTKTNADNVGTMRVLEVHRDDLSGVHAAPPLLCTHIDDICLIVAISINIGHVHNASSHRTICDPKIPIELATR